MKQDKTNVMRILDQHKISYKPFYYVVDLENLDAIHVANSLNEDISLVFKTLVCVSPKKKYYVFVINGADSIDLKKAAALVLEKSLELIHVKDLEAVTGGYLRGGTSPIGMKKRYLTIIDNKALLHKEIYISAGKRGTQVLINPMDLKNLIGADFGDIV